MGDVKRHRRQHKQHRAASINTGTISGGNGAVAVQGTGGSVSLINSGKMEAGGRQVNAILFNRGTTATLELQAGSTIVGNVVASVVSTSNTFILGGDANDSFDVSSVGASSWTLTGNGTTKWWASRIDIESGRFRVTTGRCSKPAIKMSPTFSTPVTLIDGLTLVKVLRGVRR
jgi:hypothetical protein